MGFIPIFLLHLSTDFCVLSCTVSTSHIWVNIAYYYHPLLLHISEKILCLLLLLDVTSHICENITDLVITNSPQTVQITDLVIQLDSFTYQLHHWTCHYIPHLHHYIVHLVIKLWLQFPGRSLKLSSNSVVRLPWKLTDTGRPIIEICRLKSSNWLYCCLFSHVLEFLDTDGSLRHKICMC